MNREGERVMARGTETKRTERYEKQGHKQKER